MASKQTAKLFDIGRKLKTWSIRISKFFKHRVLTKRKNGLIIGGESTQLRALLLKNLSKTWEVSQIFCSSAPQQTQTPLQNKSSQLTVAKEDKSKFFLTENYAQIEQQLAGKQFDAIIILPDQNKIECGFQDESFITDFVENHQKKIMRTVFSYRLANKYLTSSGVMLMSISQKDFLKEEPKKNVDPQITSQQASTQNNVNQSNPARFNAEDIISAQISYLGVVIGDRDYTDLNSWSVVALSEQISQTDPEYVSEMYRDWADGQKLPMPGSFALFKRKEDGLKCKLIEYL